MFLLPNPIPPLKSVNSVNTMNGVNGVNGVNKRTKLVQTFTGVHGRSRSVHGAFTASKNISIYFNGLKKAFTLFTLFMGSRAFLDTPDRPDKTGQMSGFV